MNAVACGARGQESREKTLTGAQAQATEEYLVGEMQRKRTTYSFAPVTRKYVVCSSTERIISYDEGVSDSGQSVPRKFVQNGISYVNLKSWYI